VRLTAVIGKRQISLRTSLTALALAELVVLYIVMRNGSWVYDDNFLLVRAAQEGFTWHWITAVQYEHWDVGLNVVLSLQHRLFFLDYRWALVVMLMLLGGSIYLFERSLAAIVENRRVAMAFALWFGLNILWVRPLQWWTAGLQYFTYTFFDLLCLYAFLRYYADGSRRWVAISAGSLAAALLFYEKPAYMLVYLVLVRVLLMSDDLHPRVLSSTFWRERLVWLSYLAVIGIWAIGYIDSHAYSGSLHGGVTVGQYLTYFRILWFQTLVPSLVSVTIPAAGLDGLQLLFVIVAQVALLVCIVVSLRYKRAAWRAWLFLALTVVASGILVARSRVSQFGVDIGNDPRYLIDFSWLVPLTLCAAFNRKATIKPHLPERRIRSMKTPRPVAAVIGLALIVYSVVAVVSAAHLEHVWPGSNARSWEQHLRRDIADIERTGTRFVVADNATPYAIMEPFVAPYNRLSRVLRMYVGPVNVDGPIFGSLVTVLADGTVRRATSQLIAGDGSVRALRRSHELRVAGRQVIRGGDVCVVADAGAAEVERHLSPAPSPGEAPYYLLVTFRVWSPVSFPLWVDTGAGYPGVPDHSLNASPTVASSIAWLGPSPPHRIMLTVPPLTTACLSRLDVVTLRQT
jgi:hypothetical protein